MSDDERFEPTPEQRAWLDSLSPERRHAASDALHDQWSRFRRIAESTDKIVDRMLPYAHGEQVTDFHTKAALGAEAFRALARGDYERANELFAAAEQYQPDMDSIEIIVTDPGERERPTDD